MEKKECPFCKKEISYSSTKCEHCGSTLLFVEERANYRKNHHKSWALSSIIFGFIAFYLFVMMALESPITN
jgi:predicted amidophosphoribosyltransferase